MDPAALHAQMIFLPGHPTNPHMIPENPLLATRKKELPKLDEVLGKMSLHEIKRRLR